MIFFSFELEKNGQNGQQTVIYNDFSFAFLDLDVMRSLKNKYWNKNFLLFI